MKITWLQWLSYNHCWKVLVSTRMKTNCWHEPDIMTNPAEPSNGWLLQKLQTITANHSSQYCLGKLLVNILETMLPGGNGSHNQCIHVILVSWPFQNDCINIGPPLQKKISVQPLLHWHLYCRHLFKIVSSMDMLCFWVVVCLRQYPYHRSIGSSTQGDPLQTHTIASRK